jgi:nucleotide-binding universal stress UspA family protein
MACWEEKGGQERERKTINRPSPLAHPFFWGRTPAPFTITHTRSHARPPYSFPQDPVAYEQLIRNAEAFIAARFLPRLLPLSPDPVVHVVKADVDTDSIGNVVCRKAGDLGAAALVMASHTKSRLQTFFLGSVTSYVCTHSPVPVIVVK